MQSVFGETRTHVGPRHALIAPDGHVPSALLGFDGATPFFMISPTMGAALTQMRIDFEPKGKASFAADDRERFFYLEEGEIQVKSGDSEAALEGGGFAFVPAGESVTLQAKDAARLTNFEKVFQPLDGAVEPVFRSGNAAEAVGEPFLGSENAILQTLLPVEMGWDMAVNIFTYQSGATLPFVETHIMEHGLLMLSGQGVYRLEDRYYPVKAGDVIWMAPYCPQWFVAMGDEPASYLYYKNVNRPE